MKINTTSSTQRSSFERLHFRTWAAHEELELGELEPFIGLDPLVERSGEQMPLFGGAGGPTG